MKEEAQAHLDKLRDLPPDTKQADLEVILTIEEVKNSEGKGEIDKRSEQVD